MSIKTLIESTDALLTESFGDIRGELARVRSSTKLEDFADLFALAFDERMDNPRFEEEVLDYILDILEGSNFETIIHMALTSSFHQSIRKQIDNAVERLEDESWDDDDSMRPMPISEVGSPMYELAMPFIFEKVLDKLSLNPGVVSSDMHRTIMLAYHSVWDDALGAVSRNGAIRMMGIWVPDIDGPKMVRAIKDNLDMNYCRMLIAEMFRSTTPKRKRR